MRAIDLSVSGTDEATSLARIVNLTPVFLQLSQLCCKLDEIWEENHGEVILFHWTSFLKDEILDYLHIASPLNLDNVVPQRQRIRHRSGSQQSTGSKPENSLETSYHDTERNSKLPNRDRGLGFVGGLLSCNGSLTFDPRAIQDIASQELLLPTILDHNKGQKEYVFRTTFFMCQVCFSEKVGALCTSFTGCDHVYCKECMQGYFEVQIEEGSVKALTCPSDQCDSQAHPAQVGALDRYRNTKQPAGPPKKCDCCMRE